MKPVRFHLAAVEEAEAAVRWYAERSQKASSAFLAELERALSVRLHVGDALAEILTAIPRPPV